MTLPPETRYIRTRGGDVAYQVVGRGDVDLVMALGMAGALEADWDYPPLAETYKHMSGFCRLIRFDPRGIGLSDPLPAQHRPAWEEWVDDVSAVLDAVSCPRANFYAERDGGFAVMLFAASFPQRTGALVLGDTAARMLQADDYPCGETREKAEVLLGLFERDWGTPSWAELVVPSKADDAEFRAWSARRQRMTVTPRAAAQHFREMFELDIRAALPSIQAPTLILSHRQYAFLNSGQSLYLHDHIAGSRLAEFPSKDGTFLHSDADRAIALVEEFITGVQHAPETHRVLRTVLFIDIVGSTQMAARLGDAQWRKLLQSYYATVRQELTRHRGREIDTAGDGCFALFDGPGRAVQCALAVREAMKPLGVEVRSGLHVGECEVRDDQVSGIALHIGARVMAEAGPGEVVVSGTVKDLVFGSGFQFEDRGVHELRGVPGKWPLYTLGEGKSN